MAPRAALSPTNYSASCERSASRWRKLKLDSKEPAEDLTFSGYKLDDLIF